MTHDPAAPHAPPPTDPTPRGQASRDKLLQAAQTALIDGAGDAEIADIARRAGVSAGLAYHHFGSKDGLISAVVEAFYDSYGQIAHARFPGDTWPKREIQRVRAIVQFLTENPFTPTLFGPLSRSSVVLSAEAHCMSRLIERGALNIAQGQADGDLPRLTDPAIAAAFVLGGLRQSVSTHLRQPHTPDIDALSQAIWILIAQSLGLREGSKR